MSYGIGSGETYVSDITLAFFADSGQYSANFTCGSTKMGACGGGRLVEPTGKDEDWAQRSLSSSLLASVIEEDDKEEEDISAAKQNRSNTRSPGYLRWGRHQGCNFVHKQPTKSNWGERYVCDEVQSYGCTPDNRMSSACLLVDYGTKELAKTNA